MRVTAWLLVAITLAAVALAAAAGWVLGGRQVGFAAAAKRALPSVVALYAEETGRGPAVEPGIPLGTGFVIDDAGRVLTADDVVGEADVLTAELADGRRVQAWRVGRDATAGLALLALETDAPPPPLEWSESRTLRAGDWVLIVGVAHGRPGSLSVGVATAADRRPAVSGLPYVQTHAATGAGSGGAPLVDARGRVVGVVDAALSKDGVGFALASDAARPVAVRLAEEAAAREP